MKYRKVPIGLGLTLVVLLGGCDRYAEAKDAVSRTMLEPQAARFQNVDVCDADTSIIRGTVSGKNAYGVYTDFQPFYYAQDRVVFAGDAEFSDLLRRCYSIAAAPTATAQPSADTPPASADRRPAATPKPAAGEPMDYYTPEDEAAIEEAIGKTSSQRCWQDYCPCDTSDPDYGGADVTICRNLKGGIPVDSAMFAAGAAFRDGRRQMREAEIPN